MYIFFSYFFAYFALKKLYIVYTKFVFFPISRAHHQAGEAQAVHPDGTGVTCHCVRHGVSLEYTHKKIQLCCIDLLFTFFAVLCLNCSAPPLVRFLADLMDSSELIRNVTLCGHLHHGKVRESVC